MSREERSKRNKELRNRLAKKAFGRIYENIEDAVVPRTEDFLFDIVSSIVSGFRDLILGAFEGLIYQDKDYDRRPRSRSRGERDYYDYYERKKRRREESSSVQRKEKKRDRFADLEDFTDGLISCKNWNEIYYDNRRTPEQLLRRLKIDARKYDGVRMEILYEYLKKTGGEFADTYLGWKDLDHARIQPDGPGRYWLRLPEPVDMDMTD